MKNMVKLVGIIAFVAVIGFSMVACEPENTTKDDEFFEATTAGRLTITGLSAYEGYEIQVTLLSSGEDRIEAYESATNRYNPNLNESQVESYVYGRVTGGQAVLKVFKLVHLQSGKNGGYQSYTGNDSGQFIVELYSDSNHDNNTNVVIGTVTVQFSNGIGSGAFVPDN